MCFSLSFIEHFFTSEIKFYIVTTLTALSAGAERKYSTNEENIELQEQLRAGWKKDH